MGCLDSRRPSPSRLRAAAGRLSGRCLSPLASGVQRLRRKAASRVSGPSSAWAVLVFLPLLAFALQGLFAEGDALARAGGGQSYSGGGGGGFGGGGGSDGGGELVVWLIELLIRLCISHPAIGIPLTIAIIGGVWWLYRKYGDEVSTPTPAVRRQGSRERRAAFDAIRRADPDFSRSLFEDFAYFLYGELHRGRAQDNPALKAYATDNVLATLARSPVASVDGIVIGGFQISNIGGIGTGTIRADLLIESNLTETDRDGRQSRWYMAERLQLSRSEKARSRPAQRVRVLDCPNCGAKLDAVRGNVCTYCGQRVGDGMNDWVVTSYAVQRREPRGPLLTSEPRGSNAPRATRFSPTVRQDFTRFLGEHPEESWDAIQARVRVVWQKLQEGWSRRDPLAIRPYVTDNQFQSLCYWLDMYREQKCRNECSGGTVTAIHLVALESDKSQDFMTVRIFATAPDYTVSDDGRLLSGSKTRQQSYNEYWTFVRGHSSDHRPTDPARCPACGADLEVSMAGNCQHCQAKVASGDYDWVLSRIEQEESYTG